MNRKRNTVWIALGFRLVALIYEIIMFIAVLLYFIPMMFNQRIRNKRVDHFMSELTNKLGKHVSKQK